MRIIRQWFQQIFDDPQAVILTVVLVLGTSIILVMGQDLAPLLWAIVIAYLLEGIVRQLQQGLRLPRGMAVVIVFTTFLAFMLFILLGLLPIISSQLSDLVRQLPSMLTKGQNLLLSIPSRYPEFITEVQILEMINGIKAEMATWGQKVLIWSFAAGRGFISLVIYLVLVPLLVFFFLKDKALILDWVRNLLPTDHRLAQQVWREVDRQIGNYVRGKFLEIVVVWVATYVAFALMNLQFAMLLALLVGLSVIIPYIGAVVVTVPVTVMALVQWGWGPDFGWLMTVYLIVQGVDGNILVPLLFSEVVNLHPIAIITSVLVFGGLWGFWGVFFAIPLATVVQAIYKAWPRPAPLPTITL